MSLIRTSLRLVGLLILLGWCIWGYQPAMAQDRSVPRFGGLVSADTVKAGAFDFGLQWSFAEPPLNYLSETYGLPADERGFDHVLHNTLRLPGCSGAVVSPRGLVLTAARCVRSHLSSEAPDSLQTQALVAHSGDEEYRLPDYYVERTTDVQDVTGRMDSVLASEQNVTGEGEAMAVVEEDLGNTVGPNERVDIVREAAGSRYVAYTYRRYDDVRLVMIPERSVTVYGDAAQLLTYPQHTWEAAVLRVYEDGQPLTTPNHFEIRAQGSRPGDVVLAVGHPEEMVRSETVDQHEFRRDVTLPVRLRLLDTWRSQLEDYVDGATSSSVELEKRKMEARRTDKVVQARLDALRNDYFMARLGARDEQFRIQSGQDSSLAQTVESLIADVERIQERKKALADRYRAFAFLLHPEYASPTIRRAFLAYRDQKVSTGSLEEELESIPELPERMDAALLDAHREALHSNLAADTGLVRTLDGLPSSESIVRSSAFSDAASTGSVLNGEGVPGEDPAIAFVSSFFEQYREFSEQWSSLLSREEQLTDSLGHARHVVEDLPITLANEETPRLADGRIQGYPYNGTLAPPFTTFYGLLGLFHTDTDGTEPLPARWQPRSPELDLATPLTTVASTDMGGSHGGPLLNSSLQVVGIQVDENIQSTAGRYLFLPQRMRTVAIDIRGLLEGLSTIYNADALVQEMKGTQASSR